MSADPAPAWWRWLYYTALFIGAFIIADLLDLASFYFEQVGP